jgi:hypothetical protein
MMVDLRARNAMRRIARHYRITQKAALERVLGEHQSAIVEGLGDGGAHYNSDLVEPPPPIAHTR